MKEEEEQKLPFDIPTTEAQKKKLGHFLKIITLGEPELIESILLPLERFALYEFLKRNTPLTRKMIHDFIVIEIWEAFIEDQAGGKFIKTPIGEGENGFLQEILRHKTRPTQEEINKLKGVMQKRGVKYPTYEKIETTLNTLEDWGLLTRRSEGKGKRERYFLMLNPFFPVNDRKKIFEHLDNKKEDYLTW